MQAPERTIKEKEGELVKIEELRRKKKRQEVGRARTIAELEEIARKRGYSMRWVSRMADIKHIERGTVVENGKQNRA